MVFTTAFHSVVSGASLTFSTTRWYPVTSRRQGLVALPQ